MLLVGPLPPPMGGDTRHFATLADDLKSRERFKVTLVDTSRGEQHSSLVRNLVTALKTLKAVVANRRRVDVISFHASDRGMFLYGPLIVAAGRLLRLPIVLRIFGGSFGDFYEAGNTLTRAVVRKFILSADAVLLQTQRAVRQLQQHSSGRVIWFSTYIRRVTQPPGGTRSTAVDCRRFVFLGHLWRSKGIETILEAAPQLPEGCEVDVYGPLDEYTAENLEWRGHGRIHYRGCLSHEQVDAALWNYDCLVLPTHHPGEGYPGVIAEAFAHGLPVVTTKWLAIPEIVDDTCGILIEPGDTAAFVSAVTSLHRDSQNWQRLRNGARLRAEQFDHALWSRRFEEICEELVRS